MITCIGYIHMLKIVSKTYIVIKGMLTSQANNYIVTKSLYTISISVVCVKKSCKHGNTIHDIEMCMLVY